MFKFEDYPEIKKMHEINEKFDDRTTHLQLKLEKSGENEKLDKMFDDEMKKWDDFESNEYAKLVFITFHKKIPYLINTKTNKKEKWSNVIGDDFNKLPQNIKTRLVSTVEERALYRLPPEFYNNIDRDEMFCLEASKLDAKDHGYKNPTKEQIVQAYRDWYQREPKDIDLYFPYIP